MSRLFRHDAAKAVIETSLKEHQVFRTRGGAEVIRTIVGVVLGELEASGSQTSKIRAKFFYSDLMTLLLHRQQWQFVWKRFNGQPSGRFSSLGY